MNAALDDLESRAQKSRDAISDIKVDSNETKGKIVVAQETASAFQNKFKSLLDWIYMTTGKLNVIKERANNLKSKISDIQSSAAMKNEQLTEEYVIELITKHTAGLNVNPLRLKKAAWMTETMMIPHPMTTVNTRCCCGCDATVHQNHLTKTVMITMEMTTHPAMTRMQKKKTQQKNHQHIAHKTLKIYETGGVIVSTD